MDQELSIGAVSRLTGLSVKAIRFYEEQGQIPRPRRAHSGYRRFSQRDVRRLRLLRRMRRLGLPLPAVRPLVAAASTADCPDFAAALRTVIDDHRADLDRRIAELLALRAEVDVLVSEIEACACDAGCTLLDCEGCSLLEPEEGGETSDG